MKFSSSAKPNPNANARALLRILALGNRQIKQGRVVPAAQAIQALRRKIALRKSGA